jgi:RHS repeat-associated protein
MSPKRITRALVLIGRRVLASYLALSLALGALVTSTTTHTPSAAEDLHRSGQTSTLLPGGRELLIGGEAQGGAVGSVAIVGGGVPTPLSRGLMHPRAWHTATMLPDGRVLVHGGIGANGRVVLESEVFDPVNQTFGRIATGLSPRAYHTATLLTDGQVLVVGGNSAQGDVLPTAELWDPHTGAITIVEPQLRAARARHTATLLGDGRVLIADGVDAHGSALSETEIYDPVARSFVLGQPPIPDGTTSLPAALEESIPTHGAADVPVDAILVLRFSRPLRVETLTSDDVLLWGPAGPLGLNVVPAEGGRLVFITPATPLAPQGAHTLTLHNLTDIAGFPVAPLTIEFKTAPIPNAGGAGTAPSGGPGAQSGTRPDTGANDEEWIPTPKNFKGDWKTGRTNDPLAHSLPPLQAPAGVTALAGLVLKLNGQPLPDVTLRVDRVSTRTDTTGRFLLTGVAPGVYELVIDGRTASDAGTTYGRFAVNVELKAGQTAVLPYTIWLPKLDTAHAVRIPTSTTSEVVVTTPRIPGLEFRIPPHAWIRDEEGQPVTEVTITPIPLDRPPFPLPAGVQVPLYFTVQPGGAYIYSRDGAGARLVYPNNLDKPAHEKFEFWNYHAERKGWYIYGLGTVTDDGRQVAPDPGVRIYEFSGAMVAPPPDAPAQGPPPGTTGRGSTQVDLATGLFVLQKTDLYLRDLLPIVLTRTYRPQDTVSRAFGIGATHPYEMFVTGNSNPYTWFDVVLPDGGRVHFERISPGTGYADAVFEHTSSPSAFYKARITWNGSGWDATLKNGTVYVFGNVSGALNSIRDRNGNSLALSRVNGTWGRITRITTPNGRWVDFTYDTSSRITQVKDILGRTITYGYDGSGRLASVTDPGGGVTQYTYDASHRMLTLRDPRGIVFLTNEYDTSSRATRQIRADATTYQFAYTVDGGTGRVTQTDVTNPRAYVRRVTFNSGGFVSTNTTARGTAIEQTTTYERQTGTNLVTAVVDTLGRRLEHAYDAMGNILTTTRLAGTPNAAATSYTYEPVFNQVLSVTNPLGHTMTFGYDSQGNLLTTQDPLGNITTLTYNTAGQPLTKRLPGDAMPTSYAYEFGDLVMITDPLGNQTRRFVDASGRTVSVSDPLGRQRRYDWDALDRLVKFTDALAGVTTLSHDGNDNLQSLTDLNGNTSWTPDTMDRLETRTDPLGRAERSTHDAAGNFATFTDRKSQVTAITYDALNRSTQTVYHDGSTTSYTWDVGNRLTQVADSLSGTITLTHDGFDRLIQETTPQGSVSYTYDAAGRRTSMTVAGQPTVNYSYDAANRLTQTTQGTAVVTFEYDGAGRRTRVTLPNAVSTEYAYDAASRLTGLTYKRGATVLGTLAYAYDAAGKRRQTSGTWARTGLPPAVASATYNAANQQLTFGAQSLTYDSNGSLVTQGDTTYTWDVRRRLIGIAGPGLTASFQYDPFGRRTQKTINGVTTSYIYDRSTPVQEQTVSTTANLLTGLGIDEYLTRTDADGRRAFLTDALGSTIALTDDTGAVVTEYTYDPFGSTISTGVASANPFQYTGRERDTATGLYYYRTRYYSSGLHRFISEDRIEITPWEANLYTYVGNDPVNFVDPYGEFNMGGVAAVMYVGLLTVIAILMAIIMYLIEQMAKGGGSGSGSGGASGGGAPSPAPAPAPAPGGGGGPGGGPPGPTPPAPPGADPGDGGTGDGADGKQARSEPRDLREQLALDEAKAGAGQDLTDKIFRNYNRRSPWRRMGHNHDGIEIHYWENIVTGERMGFKFNHPQ